MNDLEFDRRARALHARSLEALSPRVRAQLHNRLQAAMKESRRPRHAHRWGLATAAVLALALGVGVPWRNLQETTPAPVAANTAPAATGVPATLDQDPDFYLWLASADAVALASE